jgi:hypothetical protein
VTVDNEWEYSAGFLQALGGLAGRLEGHDIAVYDVAYSYLSFGSWSLVAGSRHRRLKFDFDGKENHLSVAESDFSDSQSRADWQTLPAPAIEAGIGVNFSKLFELVEAIAVKAFSCTAKG